MSNARSPRDVCSMTIGINGLIRFAPPSLSGGPDFRLDRLLLLRRPQLLPRPCELDGDPLHLRGDPVEGAAQPKVLTQLVEPLRFQHRRDGLLLLPLLT